MDLRTMAVSRLMLDNFDHIKAYWIMLGIGTAQTALAYGADDLDGTVRHELIYHDAGADDARDSLGRRDPPPDRRSRPRAGRARHALPPRRPRRHDLGGGRADSGGGGSNRPYESAEVKGVKIHADQFLAVQCSRHLPVGGG